MTRALRLFQSRPAWLRPFPWYCKQAQSKHGRRSCCTRSATGISPTTATWSSDLCSPHQPVLLTEVLELFACCPLDTFVDGTIGAGGHSAAVLAAHPELRQLIGIDVDPRALQCAATQLTAACKHREISRSLLQGNFSDLQQILSSQTAEPRADCVDGILLDIGVSSMQLDAADRGFSFSLDGPLDMRMGPFARYSAAEVVNSFPESELARIFRDFGEERYWRRLAQNVCEARSRGVLQTTHQLLAALRLPHRPRTLKGQRQIHPATRVFQVSQE